MTASISASGLSLTAAGAARNEDDPFAEWAGWKAPEAAPEGDDPFAEWDGWKPEAEEMSFGEPVLNALNRGVKRVQAAAASAQAETGAETAREIRSGEIDTGYLGRPFAKMYTPEEYEQRAQESAQQAGRRIVEASEIPRSAVAQRGIDALGKAETFGDVMQAIIDDPVAIMAAGGETAVESAPQMAAGLAASLLTRNPYLAAGAMGAASGATERFSEFGGMAFEKGYDIRTPKGAAAALADADLLSEAEERGITRGLIIGGLDALAGGIAAKTLARSRVGDLAAQTGAQSALGAGGEAAATAAVGDEIRPGDVALEAIAEVAGAVPEVASIRAGQRAQEATQEPQDTSAGPTPLETPASAPAPQEGEPAAPLSPLAETALLRGAGFTPDDILTMNAEERAAEVAEAQAAGVPLADAEQTRAEIAEAADRLRLDSPFLTDADRASPIPNRLIDTGKAALDRYVSQADAPRPVAPRPITDLDRPRQGFAPPPRPTAVQQPAFPNQPAAPLESRLPPQRRMSTDSSAENSRQVSGTGLAGLYAPGPGIDVPDADATGFGVSPDPRPEPADTDMDFDAVPAPGAYRAPRGIGAAPVSISTSAENPPASADTSQETADVQQPREPDAQGQDQRPREPEAPRVQLAPSLGRREAVDGSDAGRNADPRENARSDQPSEGSRSIEAGASEREVRIEDFTDKSLIVRGVSREDGKAIFDGMKGRPLWNAKQGAYVFSKKRQAEVEQRLARQEGDRPAEAAAPTPEPEQGAGAPAQAPTISKTMRRFLTAASGPKGSAVLSVNDALAAQRAGWVRSIGTPQNSTAQRYQITDAGRSALAAQDTDAPTAAPEASAPEAVDQPSGATAPRAEGADARTDQGSEGRVAAAEPEGAAGRSGRGVEAAEAEAEIIDLQARLDRADVPRLPQQEARRGVTRESREDSPFGPVLKDYKGDWRGAARELERRKTGEAPAALSHPEVGDIALVWGREGTNRNDGYGLAKLIAWHPDVLDDLQGRISEMRVDQRLPRGYINLRSRRGRAAVRLDWDGQEKTWLLTAFSNETPRRSERSTASLQDLWGDLNRPSSRRGPSDIKDRTSGRNVRPLSDADLAPLRKDLDRLGGVDVDLLIDTDLETGGIYIRDDDGARIIIGASLDPKRTVTHEFVHFARDKKLYRDNEWQVLTRRARGLWMKRYDIANRYSDKSPEVQLEEAIAAAQGEFSAGGMKSAPSLVARAFRRVQRFLEAVGNWLRGLGYQTADDVMARVQSGEVGARGQKSEEGRVEREERVDTPAEPFHAYEHRASREIARIFNPARFNFEEWSKAENWGDLRALLNRNFSDTLGDLKRQQKAIEAAKGSALAEVQDAEMAGSLYVGRTAARIEEVHEKFIKPISREMVASGLTRRQVDDYLYALHAPERNAHIAELHKIDQPDHQFVQAMKDDSVVGGSGMSNAEAAKIVAAAEKGDKAKALKKIAKLTRQMLDEKLSTQVAAGLVSEDAAKAMREVYPNYVPHKGFDGETDESGAGTGRGFDIRGAESKEATGRKSRADSPLAHAMTDAMRAIIRAEKNRVGKAFLRLAEQNPNPKAWEINRSETRKKTKTKRYLVTDPATGLPTMMEARQVVEYTVPPSRFDDQTLMVKVGGQDVAIKIHNRDLAAGLKNLDPGNSLLLTEGVGKVTRIMAALNTSWNAAWMIPNLARDAMTAAIQSSDAGIKGMNKAIFRQNYIPALRGAVQYFAGKRDSKWAQIADDFVKNGGKVAYVDFNNVEGFKDLIERETNPNALQKGLAPIRKVFDGIQVFTNAAENAIRIAAYKAALDKGMSKAKAASFARELTVNFNRRGKLGRDLNSLFMFFNAAVQGNIRLAQSVARSRFTRQMVLGVLPALGALEVLIGQGDEDEYEKIPEYIRERNIVIMLKPFTGNAGEHIKIPLPYGFNTFKVFGTEAARSMLYDQSPEESAGLIVGAMMNAFNPLGGGDPLTVAGSLEMVTPTVLDPLLQIGLNRNFFGSTIKPDWDKDAPPSTQYYPSVSDASRATTDFLNWISGGNEFRAGLLSFSPEHIDHLVGSYLGGAGRLFGRVVDTAAKGLDGELVEAEDTPILRQVYGITTGDAPTRRAYDALVREVEVLDFEIKGFQQAREPEKVRAAKDRDPVLTRMIPLVKARETLIGKLRKQIKEIRASDRSDAEKTRLIEARQERQYEARRMVLERFSDLQKEGEE